MNLRPRSLRARTTALASVVVALVLVAVAGFVLIVQRQQLLNNLDRSLEQRADQLLTSDPTDAIANSNGEDRFAQLIGADGKTIASTENLRGQEPVVPLPASGQRIETIDSSVVEDDSFRVLSRQVDPAGEVLIVGENIDDLRDALRSLAISLAVVVPFTVVALGAVIWWLVGRTLRPVDEIREEVDGIGLDELDHRVPVPGTDDEVERLAATMNEMLDRLEQSTEQQRRFVADVSHELRSPLTRMRTSLEVDLENPETDLRATAEGVLDDAVGMQRVVDDLLFLARRDSAPAASGRLTQPVDLDAIVADEIARARSSAPADIVIHSSGVGAADLLGVEAQLTRMVRNLLENAVAHAGSAVEVSLRQTFGDDRRRLVELRIDDDGPGIGPEDRARIFDRFTRLDDARAATGGGTGLGLAIVSEIVKGHGGTIDVSTSTIGGARFTVQLPANDL